ncbi:MAG: phosphoribosylanthranilate isomerase, partial [Bdellovibrionales bacterium]|nr:phosphoribosylanthranilate isomerase [Bdellovibrionales bacterium]
AIGVFQNASHEDVLTIADNLRLDGVQLHGVESVSDCEMLRQKRPDLVILKSIDESMSAETQTPYLNFCDALLLDSPRTQPIRRPLDWKALSAGKLPSPLFLAGGLNPSNLEEAIRFVLPQGVDVSSGVESSTGVKDLFLMREFFRIAKETV